MIDFEFAPEPGVGARLRSAAAPAVKPIAPDAPDSELPPYLRALNPRQREASLTVEGPLLVLAGAGSGKTQMLISRISYLISHLHVPPGRILAVTFTNKAAREMKERVERALGGGMGMGPVHYEPEIGTFHSVCVRLIRREMQSTPFTKPFVIYDDSDQLSLVKSVMTQLNIDTKSVNPKAVQAAINRAKCDALEPQDLKPGQFSFFERQSQRIYEQYQKNLFANNALDFGEIICLAYRMLRDNPELRAKYRARFRYVHVDEYQDTNKAQYLLLSQLVDSSGDEPANLCVVGDEDQSIYKWRGADISNILDFEKDYPGAKVVKLEQNYRSTQNIISAASKVISHNTQRKEKTLWTQNPSGEPVRHLQFADERAEAEHVITLMSRMVKDEGVKVDDFALFYRTHAQSRQFEDVLRREKIPYQVVGGVRFYDRKEIKDVLCYFRVVLNPSDSVSLSRILNVPGRGIGKSTIERLDQLLHEQRTLAESGSDGGITDLWSLLAGVAEGRFEFPKRVSEKIRGFVTLMARLMDAQPKLLVSELYHLVLDETAYVRELKEEGTVESLARVENLEEFDTLLQEFEEGALGRVTEAERAAAKAKLLEQFIEQSTLVSETDKEFQPASVKLMTLHSSKGLEFPVVFMVGMEEGLFPSSRSWEETPPEEIEEERRLCYVGMTRARKRLFLTNAVTRRLWGQFLYQEPARFLAEIPVDLMESLDFAYAAGAGQRPRASVSPSAPRAAASGVRVEYDDDAGSGSYKSSSSSSKSHVEYDGDAVMNAAELVGRKLKHPSYGGGTIVDASGEGDQAKVTVEFAYKVRRKFLFRFVVEYLLA